MNYRAFVTFPTGQNGIFCANIQTPEQKQSALNQIGGIVERNLGTMSQSIPPERRKEFAAKVEFFRVAIG